MGDTSEQDVIERMRARAIDTLRNHGWTVTDMSGEGYAQLDEALEAAVRVLLEALRAFNVKTSDGKPRQWLGSEAELNGALLNDFERQIGLTAPAADAPRVTVAATGWDADGENRD